MPWPGGPRLAALQRIGLQPAVLARALALGSLEWPTPRLVRLTGLRREACQVDGGSGPEDLPLWPALRVRLQVAGQALAVGDWLWVAQASPGQDWVVAQVPPEPVLRRRDPRGGHQVLVSGIDLAVLVLPLGPGLNLRRLDRFLVLARAGAVRTLVLLSQADRLSPGALDHALARARAHLGPHQAVLAGDMRAASTAAALQPWLRAGQTLVALGPSGSGKSSLVRNLMGLAAEGDAGPRTGPARAQDGRGRHTTRERTLWRVPGGACVIDTPGLRQLWLDASPEDVDLAFGDVARLAPQCRFRDCRHASEPGCAVRGEVGSERLRSWQGLQREAARDAQDPMARREQLSQWKQRRQAARERGRLMRDGCWPGSPG